MTPIPNVPIDPVPAPSSQDLGDLTNTYPQLTPIKGYPTPDSVGPEVANAQPEALDRRTETLRDRVNKLIEALNTLGENVLLRAGTDATPPAAMSGDLDMGTPGATPSDPVTKHKVVNVANGTDASDAVNMTQFAAVSAAAGALSNALGGLLKKDGSTPMTGSLDANSNAIRNVGSPTKPTDAANRAYVDKYYGSLASKFLRLDGTTAMNADLNMGGHKITGVVTSAPLAGGDVITAAHLDAVFNSASVLPTGAIIAFGSPIHLLGTPAGFLICDGSLVDKDAYGTLYETIGDIYAKSGDVGAGLVGADSNYFRVPDLRARTPVGMDNMGAGGAAGILTGTIGPSTFPTGSAQLGFTFGEASVALAPGEIPAHAHGYADHLITTASGSSGTAASGGSNGGATTVSGLTSANTPAGSAHNNLQPGITVYYLIKS